MREEGIFKLEGTDTVKEERPKLFIPSPAILVFAKKTMAWQKLSNGMCSSASVRTTNFGSSFNRCESV